MMSAGWVVFCMTLCRLLHHIIFFKQYTSLRSAECLHKRVCEMDGYTSCKGSVVGYIVYACTGYSDDASLCVCVLVCASKKKRKFNL